MFIKTGFSTMIWWNITCIKKQNKTKTKTKQTKQKQQKQKQKHVDISYLNIDNRQWCCLKWEKVGAKWRTNKIMEAFCEWKKKSTNQHIIYVRNWLWKEYKLSLWIIGEVYFGDPSYSVVEGVGVVTVQVVRRGNLGNIVSVGKTIFPI